MNRSLPSTTADTEQKDREHRLAALALDPSASAAIHLISAHGEVGLSRLALMDELKRLADAVKQGDLSHIEEMLLCQAQVLQAVSIKMAKKMMTAEDISQLQTFAAVFLKAQNQSRSSLATLAEMKNPRRTTFIQQQNNAVNQQINQDGIEPKNPKILANPANELLSEAQHATLDTRGTITAGGTDSQLAPLGKSRGQNAGR